VVIATPFRLSLARWISAKRTPQEVLEYVQRAAPDAVARWELGRANRDIAEARAQAVIERALQAANSSGAAIGNQ
jgi:hypothetical protein